MKYENLIEKSFDLIELPNCKRKHFSFVLWKKKIISVGWNNAWRTHPISNKFGHRFNAIHSELAAIKNMSRPVSFLKECKLVNIRVNRHGLVLMSKPCGSCENMLKYFGIREIVYTNNDGKFVEL